MDNKDISGISLDDINEDLEKSLFKKWIKIIPINKTISFDNYNRRNYFHKIAEIKINDNKNCVIKFIPEISKTELTKKAEWLYLFIINNRIVKIGGTRTSLKGRIISYLCGHHIKERGKSGDCSKTNAFIYNTFEFYLNKNCKIEMYGYELPKKEISIDIFGNEIKIIAQTYHAYESIFIEDYKKNYNDYPILNDNCDPEYKNL